MSSLQVSSPPGVGLLIHDSETSRSSYDNSFRVQEDQCSSMLEPKDVCEEVLGNKMAALELNGEAGKNQNGDGSDSGVDIATNVNVCLQRALSSNSGGYASSNGCLDESNLNGNVSCDSSMISYSSDLGDHKTVNTAPSQNSNYECLSENGSESSSVNGGPATVRKSNLIKKKVALFEPPTRKPEPVQSTAGQLSKQRSRVATVQRTLSLTRPNQPNLQARERARSREKPESPSTSSSKNTTPPYKSTPVRRPQKPDSLPAALNVASPSIQRIVQRTPSLTRARTPGTPSDDGRWPSVGGRGVSMGPPKRGTSATPDLAAIKSRVNMMSLDLKSSPGNANIYGTLPRRKKQKSVEDLTGGRSSRSSSASRENRMTSSVIVPAVRRSLAPYRDTTPSRTLPPTLKARKLMPKTKIYHETSVQTAITSSDLEKAFAGSARAIKVDAAETTEKCTQSDIRDKEMERLKALVEQLTAKQTELNDKLNEKTQKISAMEQQMKKEREEKIAVQRELHLNTERVIGMLELARGTPTEEHGCDSLLMLESQIQMSGHELVEKQSEINKLRRICRTLQVEMERSLAAQECLIQEKATLERESSELQDFLQNEKAALCDALKEAEVEMENCKKILQDKEEEVKVLRDECRHLVRLNEQRRQENKTMQSKYAALEAKSKDLMLQQGSSVSGASVALSGLHTRLDSLVEQLISSYNISEQDLEDVVFHNEAYTNSLSSCDGSPESECQTGIATADPKNDGSLSPQRNQSFIAAVISAIRSATSSSGKKFAASTKHKKVTPNGVVEQQQMQNGDESDSTEMLDSETEPCLMMDNVLEDVTMPDSHSHNMVSSTGLMISQIEVPSDLVNAGDESLHNLSQAITNRQQIELQINSLAAQKVAQLRRHRADSLCCDDDTTCHDSVAEMPSITEYCTGQAMVDQVIEVDNLVTKLLKVLRLIQMDNDNCIQHLIVDKNKLQLNKEEMLEKLKDLQDVNVKLQDELMDATQELMLKGSEMSSTKAEIQRHRNEIDVRF